MCNTVCFSRQMSISLPSENVFNAISVFCGKIFTIDRRVFVVTNFSFFGIDKPVYLFLIDFLI